VLLCLLGTATMVAVAGPMATVIARLMPTAGESAAPLAAGIAGFAPGLVGYGLFAVLSRALYARGETTAAAVAAAAGWAAVAVAAVGLSAALPDQARVAALTVANSVGMSVLGLALLGAVSARAGRGALAGLPRAAAAGLLAGVTGALAGRAVVSWLPAQDPPTAGGALVSGMLAGVVVGAVFVAVAWALDRRDIGVMVAGVARQLRRSDGGAGQEAGR
jgi:putative peptidoglycan lipid II flippase